MDTSLPGNLNTGHEFRNLTAAETASLTPFQRKKLAEGKGWAVNGVLGPELTDEERWALIEYIKSLGSPQPAQEFPPRGETAAIKRLTQIQGLIQRYGQITDPTAYGPQNRGQHAKSHGVVQASFRVAEDLPDRYKVGIFAEPKDYQAVIRFSNGKERDDRRPDIHGMAIKVYVPTARDPRQAQDFVLADNPVFFAKSVEHLLRFLELKSTNAPLPQLLAEFPQLATIRKSMTSPLETKYCSQTPYKFGDLAVKYHVAPSSQNKQVIAKDQQGESGDENFLRKVLQNQLIDQPASFDFYIQEQTDFAAMPIEDPTVEWKSKPIKLATITIEPQTLDTLKDKQDPETLSFNPWHALPEHRPLGGINRARRVIYPASSEVRHAAKTADQAN